jgi:hypothetical protein
MTQDSSTPGGLALSIDQEAFEKIRSFGRALITSAETRARVLQDPGGAFEEAGLGRVQLSEMDRQLLVLLDNPDFQAAVSAKDNRRIKELVKDMLVEHGEKAPGASQPVIVVSGVPAAAVSATPTVAAAAPGAPSATAVVPGPLADTVGFIPDFDVAVETEAVLVAVAVFVATFLVTEGKVATAAELAQRQRIVSRAIAMLEAEQ